MKIAHLTTADISLWYLLLPQLKAVRQAGGEAIGISAPGEYTPDLEAAGIRHIPLQHSTRGRNFGADLKVIRELWGTLRQIRPDVLHTHNPKPGVYGRIVGRLAGVPVVLNTVHGLYASPDDSLPKKAVVYSLEAVAARFSDYELVQSIEDCDLLTRWRITRPDRTILLGNGIDVRRFDPGRFDASDRLAIRNELALPQGAFVTGIVARLVRGKGFVELTEAVGSLNHRHVIVAIGPKDPDKNDALTPAEIARAEAAGVRFLGHRDDVDRLYAVMDAFVLPSHREGFPRAAMEAAAMGLPIAASDIRGCRQVVDDGVTGILFPLRSAKGIAAALTLLATKPSLREKMGTAARSKALDEFDERSVVETVLRTQISALREKGYFERLRMDSDASFTVRWATEDDLRVLAGVCVSEADLTRIGNATGVLARRRYRSSLADRLANLVVVEDGYGPVGFAVRPASDGRQGSPSERPRRSRQSVAVRDHVPLQPINRSLDRRSSETLILVAEPFQRLGLEEQLRKYGNPQPMREPPTTHGDS